MRKTILTLLIVLTVLGLLAVNTGCKKNSYNITGIWQFNVTLEGETFVWDYEFVGTKSPGVVYFEGADLGTYSVMDRNVSFTLEYFDQDGDYTVEVYNGYFDAPDEMSGSMTYSVEGYATVSGTWWAY